MALYIDTSCLLKLFIPEVETARVAELVGAENRVIVSTLARLEAVSHLHARVAGGLLSRRFATNLVRRIDRTLEAEPYEIVFSPASMVDVAEAQVRPLASSLHCRTLDRLHLAVMQIIGVQRLLTNDDRQAAVARALGLEVSVPR